MTEISGRRFSWLLHSFVLKHLYLDDGRQEEKSAIGCLARSGNFLVVGHHLEMSRPSGVVGAFAYGWLCGGLGVDLFFGLSGFLIGGLLLTELERHGKNDVPRFLLRQG